MVLVRARPDWEGQELVHGRCGEETRAQEPPDLICVSYHPYITCAKGEGDQHPDHHVVFTASDMLPGPMYVHTGAQLCIEFLLGGSGIRQKFREWCFHRLIWSFPSLIFKINPK